MNKTFKYCVKLLQDLAASLNMTYEEVNIWIFVIIEPLVFFILLWIMHRQYLKIKVLKAQRNASHSQV